MWFVICLFAPPDGRAATFLVASSAELQAALTAAQDNGQDDTINIAAGVLVAGTQPFTYTAGPAENFALTISGAGSAATVLSGAGAMQVFRISTVNLVDDANASISLRNVSIQAGVSIGGSGGALDVSTNRAVISIANCQFRENIASAAAGVARGGSVRAVSASGGISVTGSQFTGNGAQAPSGRALGGGASLESVAGSISVESSRFEQNTASSSSGVTSGGGLLLVSRGPGTITLSGTSFSRNQATSSSGTAQGGGATILHNGSGAVTLSDNVFQDNAVAATQFAQGGGAFASAGSGPMTLTANTFQDNRATTPAAGQVFGGGADVLTTNSGSIALNRNRFVRNQASSSSGVVRGGGVETATAIGGDITLGSNVFVSNTANAPTGRATAGGANVAAHRPAMITLTNNTFASNTTTGGGGGLALASPSPMNVYNNIVVNNAAATGFGRDIFVFDLFNGVDGVPVTLRNNDLADVMSGCANTPGCTPHVDRGTPDSNIDADPLFVDAASGNVRLLAGSPVIDKGATDAPGLPPTDVEGGRRTIGPAPDIGAEEFTANPLTALGPAIIRVGLRNSDDVGARFDLKAEVFLGTGKIGEGRLDNAAGGNSGFNNAVLDTIRLTLPAPVDLSAGPLGIRLSVRISCTGRGHASGTARLWLNDAQANSRVQVTINGISQGYFLLDGFRLGTSPGSGPKSAIDAFVDSKTPCPGRPFQPFGTWMAPTS